MIYRIPKIYHLSQLIVSTPKTEVNAKRVHSQVHRMRCKRCTNRTANAGEVCSRCLDSVVK